MGRILTRWKMQWCGMIDLDLVAFLKEEAKKLKVSEAEIVRQSIRREKRLSDAREQRRAVKAAV